MIRLFFETLMVLIMLHALADFALQTSVMAQMKSKAHDIKRRTANKGKYGQRNYQLTWFYWLTAHALIHGLLVYIYLGPLYALITSISHWLIDKLKTRGVTDIHLDQAMHLVVILFNAAIVLYRA